eukprot:m.156660 g.156660  ORF g.156660 m.156660 type:complete len:64 (-) comp17946_c0_seq1:1815-2006(-)
MSNYPTDMRDYTYTFYLNHGMHFQHLPSWQGKSATAVFNQSIARECNSSCRFKSCQFSALATY